MKKRLLGFVFMTALLTLMTACEYDFIEPTPPPPTPPAGDTISYSQDIQPFFTAKCASCHPAIFKPDLTAGKSYASLSTGNYFVAGEPLNSSIYTKIATGGTMATYTTAEQADLVYRWIYAGAKND